ncbi:DUF3153 domain-containing protein [Chamaesiphon minutus]|uniref:DUF3153 domain-containing protein n=1 Tax=Chamaesiphon minutus (strain ATCC 27169 / PCC 6605) TaxID=1173020 RepID=K9UJE2_CHAP6|nr:DUF3153 domain-containing protein [Chamaesiphon minutus]AFY94935.1 Protein of unknown function (DUF3153) [Chamaesiphon minutus PCC 6605]
MKIQIDKDKVAKLANRLLSPVGRHLAIGYLLLAIVLSGCVKYDTSINFSSLNDGEIVERIQLGDRLHSFSQDAVKKWVDSIERRTIQAQGRIEHLNDRELKVIIPFNNSQELIAKIDRYFNPSASDTQSQTNLKSHMTIDRINLLLAVRNHLIYDIDLRSLSIASTDPKVSVAADNSVELNFSIQSPWGVKSGELTSNITSVKKLHNQTIWQLKPGQIDRIEAIFWLPNPLAIGGLIISLISLAGYYFKYRQLPWPFAFKSIDAVSS